jgi:carboxypeptidase C (cathepsin A)
VKLFNNWCNNATVIFVDAPPGTGFSKAGRNIDFLGNDVHFAKEATSFVQ